VKGSKSSLSGWTASKANFDHCVILWNCRNC